MKDRPRLVALAATITAPFIATLAGCDNWQGRATHDFQLTSPFGSIKYLLELESSCPTTHTAAIADPVQVRPPGPSPITAPAPESTEKPAD